MASNKNNNNNSSGKTLFRFNKIRPTVMLGRYNFLQLFFFHKKPKQLNNFIKLFRSSPIPLIKTVLNNLLSISRLSAGQVSSLLFKSNTIVYNNILLQNYIFLNKNSFLKLSPTYLQYNYVYTRYSVMPLIKHLFNKNFFPKQNFKIVSIYNQESFGGLFDHRTGTLFYSYSPQYQNSVLSAESFMFLNWKYII